MEGIAVSIIIPIYNAEKFLKKGLDSCVNQTMQNIEVICVNNASEDNSALIIEEYVKKYPDKVKNFELTKNRGPGGARNHGILHAQGEYLCFMDSDDYLDIYLCEDVYKKAKTEDAEMVFYDYIYVDGLREYQVEAFGEEELGMWYRQLWNAPWQQIVKKKIVLENELFFPENTGSEDDAIIPLWRFYAKKRCKMQKSYYYYVNRQNSLMKETIVFPMVNAISYRYKIMQQKGILDAHKAESDWMIANDIRTTLMKLMRLTDSFTTEKLMYLHQQFDFLKEKGLDDSITKYYIPCLDIEMINDFLYSPDIVAEKYGNFALYMRQQGEKGLSNSIEEDIADILSDIKYCHGTDVALWGAGRAGIPIITTLYRMGYCLHIYDNGRHGEKVCESIDEHIRSFEDLSGESANVLLVTSDIYYKQIEKQIHQSYPDIAVINFKRMLRYKALKNLDN